MRRGLIFSVILHVTIILLFIHKLPAFSYLLPEESIVTLDLVDITEITSLPTNSRAKKEVVQESGKKKNAVPMAQNLPEGGASRAAELEHTRSKLEKTSPALSATLENKQQTEVPSPLLEVQVIKKEALKPRDSAKPKGIPIHPAKQLKEQKDNKVDPNPDTMKNKDKQAKNKQAKKEQKKEPKKEQKKGEQRGIWSNNVLKSLKAAEEKEVKKDNGKVDEVFTAVESLISSNSKESYNPELSLTISEQNMIKSQIIRAWTTTPFMGGAVKDMRVKVHIALDSQGNVLKVAIKKDVGQDSPHYKVFVESAVRAVYIASPLQNLPLSKYETWKEIDLMFNSKDLIH